MSSVRRIESPKLVIGYRKGVFSVPSTANRYYTNKQIFEMTIARIGKKKATKINYNTRLNNAWEKISDEDKQNIIHLLKSDKTWCDEKISCF